MLMLALEIHTYKIPETFLRFSDLIGETHWRKRVQQCKNEIKGNPLLRDYLHREYEIAFQLNHLSEINQRYGGISLAESENQDIYPACCFAAQALSIIDAAGRVDAERFRRRIHGAFKNPADMRGLQLELTAATHFARIGRKISWPETSGIGTFDLLVEGEGHEPLEVECKSIGDDKGHRINRREMIDFAAIFRSTLISKATNLQHGISIILEVPDRLPNTYKSRVELAKSMGRAIVNGIDGSLIDGANVRIVNFDPSLIGDPRHLDGSALRKAIDAVSGTDNRPALIISLPSGGMVALTIQSQRDDAFLTSIFNTLSDAAKRQLSGTRAGLLFTGFDGLDGGDLQSIAAQDNDSSQRPTALRVAISKFLSSNTRNHIIGVGFVSRESLRPIQKGSITSGGVAYYFPKKESLFWSESFNGLFKWSS